MIIDWMKFGKRKTTPEPDRLTFVVFGDRVLRIGREFVDSGTAASFWSKVQTTEEK